MLSTWFHLMALHLRKIDPMFHICGMVENLVVIANTSIIIMSTVQSPSSCELIIKIWLLLSKRCDLTHYVKSKLSKHWGIWF